MSKEVIWNFILGPKDVIQANPLVLIAIAVALLIVSYVIMSMLMPKPPKNKPASLEDFDMPTHEEGTPESVVFGEAWCKGPMVLHYGHLRTKKIKAEGGK